MTQAIYMDNTKMSDYQECQVKYYLRHVLGLVPNKEGMALTYGKAIHEGLSKWYETGDLDLATSMGFDEYVDNPMDDKRTAMHGIDTLQKYAERYPLSTEPFEIIANELAIEERICEDAEYTYNLIGKIDLLVKWSEAIYGLDHKTTSRLGSTYFYQYNLSRQMVGYYVGLRKMYEGTTFYPRIQGMLINAIAVYKGNRFKFERELKTYSTSVIKKYNKYIPVLMREIQEKTNLFKTQGINEFVPNWDSCSNWGGCRYRKICESSRPQLVISQDYHVDFWDPREEFL
jgi:hypothetical protein